MVRNWRRAGFRNRRMPVQVRSGPPISLSRALSFPSGKSINEDRGRVCGKQDHERAASPTLGNDGSALRGRPDCVSDLVSRAPGALSGLSRGGRGLPGERPRGAWPNRRAGPSVSPRASLSLYRPSPRYEGCCHSIGSAVSERESPRGHAAVQSLEGESMIDLIWIACLMVGYAGALWLWCEA